MYIAHAIGASMTIEYLLSLTNLNYANSPMDFPEPYQYYPCSYNNATSSVDCSGIYTTGYIMPLFINSETLRSDLPLAMYLGIDMLTFQLNDLWFDCINLALITIYFFKYGNPQYNFSSVKISFSKTRSLEKKLRYYAKMQDEKLKRG
jgi:hypothetical protein